MNCLSFCQLTCLWWLFGTNHSRCDTSWCIFAETMKALLILMFRQSSFFKYSNIQKSRAVNHQEHLYSLAWKDLVALTVHFVRFPGSDVTKIIWTSHAISFRTKDVRFLSFSFVMNRLDDPLDKAEQLRSIDCVLNRNWIWYSRCCKMQKKCTSAPSNALLIL